MIRDWNNALSGAVVGAILIATLAGVWIGAAKDQRDAARDQAREQQAEIAALKQEYADAQMQSDDYAKSLTQCRSSLSALHASLPASPDDADYVTILASEINAQGESPDPQQSPIVVLGNAYRPGLGTLLGSLAQTQASPSPGDPQSYSIRWIVAGRVTPYIAPGASATVAYAWVNVKTREIETRQPDPVGALLSRYQTGGAQ